VKNKLRALHGIAARPIPFDSPGDGLSIGIFFGLGGKLVFEGGEKA